MPPNRKQKFSGGWEPIELKQDSWSYVARGYVHLDIQNYELAITDFKKSLKLNSKRSSALLGLVVIYSETGKTIESKKCYKKAIKLEPRFKNGMKGIKEMENNGRFFTPKTKEVFKFFFGRE